jgi:hypothetical protein
MSLDALKPAPTMDTVRFESEPAGAEARTSSGQTCRTPCALALPVNTPLTVTFTLTGYQPAMQNIEPSTASNGTAELKPNPVQVELVPTPPPPKPVKPAKKPVAKKPAKPTAQKPAATSASASPPLMAAPAQQQPSPSTPQPTR